MTDRHRHHHQRRRPRNLRTPDRRLPPHPPPDLPPRPDPNDPFRPQVPRNHLLAQTPRRPHRDDLDDPPLARRARLPPRGHNLPRPPPLRPDRPLRPPLGLRLRRDPSRGPHHRPYRPERVPPQDPPPRQRHLQRRLRRLDRPRLDRPPHHLLHEGAAVRRHLAELQNRTPRRRPEPATRPLRPGIQRSRR